MRLYDYLKKQGVGEEETKFRLLKLKLIKKRTYNEQIIKKISQEYNIDENIILELREALNRDLIRKGYKGPEKFDFVLDEGIDIDNIKLENRKKDLLKKRYLELESELSKIKCEFEKKLKN